MRRSIQSYCAGSYNRKRRSIQYAHLPAYDRGYQYQLKRLPAVASGSERGQMSQTEASGSAVKRTSVDARSNERGSRVKREW
eukprot:2318227-Rhodomonas_salina.3